MHRPTHWHTDASIVEGAINPSEDFNRVANHCLDISGAGHVGPDENSFTALLLDSTQCFFATR